MVTMIKHTIPSEEAEQIHLGDGTETASTTPLTREPRSINNGRGFQRQRRDVVQAPQ